MKNMMNKFINDEIWALTFGGAFQRANVYAQNVGDSERTKFRMSIKVKVRELVDQYYQESIPSEEQHIENISSFCTWAGKNFNYILNGGKLRFGIAQKLINLHLKYLWCLDKIPTPPHCPFDRIIISKLGNNNSTNWTELDCKETYIDLVNKAKEQAGSKSIAEWELFEFSRK